MVRLPSMKVGDRHRTKKHGWTEVIEYKNSLEVTIRFLDTGNTKVVRSDNLKRGNVRDVEADGLAKLDAGTVHPTVRNGDVRILEYKNFENIHILFLDSNKTKWVTGGHIRTGYLAPPED